MRDVSAHSRVEYAVLMVCMGNICRSPTAEGVLRKLHAQQAGTFDLQVDSAGTHADYHLGEAPDPRSQRAALRHGYDIAAHRARRVRAEDFSRFDYVLAMDGDNLERLRALQRADARAKLGLLLDYAPEQPVREVPDPYNGGADGFEQVIMLVEQACLGLLKHLNQRAGAARQF